MHDQSSITIFTLLQTVAKAPTALNEQTVTCNLKAQSDLDISYRHKQSGGYSLVITFLFSPQISTTDLLGPQYFYD